MTDVDDTPRPDPHILAQAYQDNLIANRQPPWLKNLTGEQLDELSQAMKTSLRGRRLIATRLRQVQRIDHFTVPVVREALQGFDPSFDPAAMRFDQGVFRPVTSWGPNRAPIHEVEYRTIPLMEAVLWNFTAGEAKEGGQREGNCLVDAQGKEVQHPSAIEFARLCRELDLGARYQAHLDGVLHTPWSDHDEQVDVPSLLEQTLKADMLMEAYKARYHHGTLDDQELQLILGLCRSGVPGRLEGDEVMARQLSLFGCRLEQIVVLDVKEDGLLFGKNRKRVLAYIPGDPHGPWSAFDSLEAFARQVPGKRLRESAYQGFFKRFVPLAERAAFFAQVRDSLGDLAQWATRDLNEQLQDYPRPLFSHLATAHSLKVMTDAAVVLSPVAQLDQRLQRDHHQRLASDGWLLLSLASFFVPEIALAFLALLAWEVLGAVFEGIEAWFDGDMHEAVEHFFDVGKRLAAIAAMVAGGKLLARLLPGADTVDGLVATRLENGQEKLWTMDLVPFRSAHPPEEAQVDEQGIHRLNDQRWVDMDGHYYAVQRTADRQLQVRPRNGHGPLLSRMGAGGWRLQCDDPAGWSDVHQMFRRLGEAFRPLHDEQIDQVMAIHGLDADQLRALHVRTDAVPAELLDTAMRVRMAERVIEVENKLRLGVPVWDFEALQAAQGLPGAADVFGPALASLVQRQRRQLLGELYRRWSEGLGRRGEGLLRQFSGLHRCAAQALLRQASVEDSQRFTTTGRVPLRLAEAARSMALRVRAIRVHEAFALETPQTSDLARVALGMLKHVAGAPQIRWRLFEGEVNGPLLFDTSGNMASLDLVHDHGQFRLFAGGLTNSAAGELFTVMAGALNEEQRATLALGEPFPARLQSRLGQEAAQRRGEVERLLSPTHRGALAALQRLDAQRIGFPLSGRGAIRALGPSALYPEVRRIYPCFDVEQIVQWLADLEREGQQVWEALPRLRQQLLQLEETLHKWHVASHQDAGSQAVRGMIKERLIDAWRRIPAPGEGVDSVLFTGGHPGQLPVLPAGIRFSQVTELGFQGMGLPGVPAAFLEAFPNLRVLRLKGNRLTRLPNQLALDKLTVLELYNNQIVLDTAQATVLARCENLEYINLADNPLGRSFSVSGMLRLRKLRLRNTQIESPPNGLEDCPLLELADLRDNRITRLPQELMGLPSWTGRTIRLDGNPLDRSQLERLRSAPQDEESGSVVAERWATAAPAEVRQKLVEYWTQLQASAHSAGVMSLLGLLQKTARFRQQPRLLANRVYRMLQGMQSNARLRDELFAHVDDGLTCQDGHLWRFSMLEVRMKAWSVADAASPDEAQAALIRFGRRLWRLYKVEELVSQRIPRWPTRQNIDPLEVVMGYQLALREHLELPIEADEMAYPQDAHLDVLRIGRIRDEVLAHESQSELASWLVDQPFWSEFMDKAYQARFVQLDESFHRQLEAVLEESQAAGAAGRKDTVGDIQRAQGNARRRLMIDLTFAAMDTPAGGTELLL